MRFPRFSLASDYALVPRLLQSGGDGRLRGDGVDLRDPAAPEVTVPDQAGAFREYPIEVRKQGFQSGLFRFRRGLIPPEAERTGHVGDGRPAPAALEQLLNPPLLETDTLLQVELARLPDTLQVLRNGLESLLEDFFLGHVVQDRLHSGSMVYTRRVSHPAVRVFFMLLSVVLL